LAITFSGEFTSPRTPDEVYDFLSDPNKFAPLLPDYESMSVQDATHFTVKVRVGVGNIRGSAEIKMELAEAVRPQRALYRGKGSAVGSQITVNAGFDLSPVDGATRIAWQGEAGVFGKLASMAGGMLEPLGKKNIQKLIDGLQSALTRPPAQVIAQGAPSTTALEPAAEQPLQAQRQDAASETVDRATPQPQQLGAQNLADDRLKNAAVHSATPTAQSTNSSAEELPSDASQSVAVQPTSKPAADQIPTVASESAATQHAAIPEGPNTRQESSPQGGTNVAQDVSPG